METREKTSKKRQFEFMTKSYSDFVLFVTMFTSAFEGLIDYVSFSYTTDKDLIHVILTINNFSGKNLPEELKETLTNIETFMNISNAEINITIVEEV